jgi:hypothetical protein
VDIGGTVPQSVRLLQNFPNPFNPTTLIRYRIPARCDVSLTVHDVSGAEVSILVREEKPAGEYEAAFDATGLASGVYLCRLAAGKVALVTKMVLIR